MNKTILLVDDDDVLRDSLADFLSSGYTVHTASNGREALDVINQESDIDIILSDIKMPEMGGIELMEKLQALNRDITIIFMTGFSTIESAVDSIKMGAYDYLRKPLDMHKLELTIRKAIENKKLTSELTLLRKQVKQTYDASSLVGNSPKMRAVLELISRISSTKATVLIQGESGTGKELIANILHYNSLVSNGPFIKVNCSALSEGVLESELFGHEKGAFTGALFTKKGLFEVAHEGTLFLDEIGDIPLSIQVKLLRFLQESEFSRVGSAKTIKVDVRIISATNKDLTKLVAEEKFRDDLYYRLKVVTIEAPPLREKVEDIPLLVDFHLKRFSKIHNKMIKGISPEAMKLIKSYHWPGNIRELMNCLESAVVMTLNDQITPENLPPFLSQRVGIASEKSTLHAIEKKAIYDALATSGNDKTKAAQLLGINLRTIYRKLKQYEAEDK